MRLLSTVGWNVEVVSYVIDVLDPDEVVFFYGFVSEEDKKKVLKVLKTLEESYTIKIRKVQVNPMALGENFEKMARWISDESVANITGGTKIMSFALALNAAMRGIPILYVVTEDGKRKILRVPIIFSEGMRNFFRIENKNSVAMRTLRILVEDFRGRARFVKLKERLGKISSSTVSDAKRRLLMANLIREEKEGKEKIIIANSGAYLLLNGGDGN